MLIFAFLFESGDHGHVTTSFDRKVDINEFINVKKDLKGLYGFTNVFLYTKPNKKQSVYRALKEASEKDTIFRVFLKADIIF